MNIFKNTRDFIGNYNDETGIGSVFEMLSVSKEIQTKLGKQAYLMDAYLTMFLTASQYKSVRCVEEYVESTTSELWAFCRSIIGKQKDYKSHPLYARANEILNSQIHAQDYQEEYTSHYILCIAIVDDYIDLVVKEFIKTHNFELSTLFEVTRFRELYAQISYVIGEAPMERFNLLLQQRFLVSPILPIFIKAINSDLLFTLLSRDDETNKQIFQLARDILLTN